MNKLIFDIRKKLKKNVEPAYKKGSLNFFKEKIRLYGVRSPQLKKIESSFWPKVKLLNKKDFISLTEALFKSNFNEEFSLACGWLSRRIDEFTSPDFKLLEGWLKKYVTNWAMCDDYCTHPLGYFIYKYPQFIKRTKKWAADKNRWVKRAAAVVHIHPTKKSSPFFKNINKNKIKYLKDVFEVADKLLTDADDLVQKGYGWTLKEAANLFQKNIFDFVMNRKNRMPRTALRYAIEKMPLKLKKRAMR
jgi:3-methyladenine DNA glycosylase AlkD